jgi:hypothetical protein
MYQDIVYDNDYERIRLAQASRRAAQGWRFRHHKDAASRVLSVAWAGVKGLIHKALAVEKPAIAPAHKRLSY